MIDAAAFAEGFGAFWRNIAPTSELVVRRLNLGEVNRFDVPLRLARGKADPALVAEVGFAAFELVNRNEVARTDPRGLIDASLVVAMRHHWAISPQSTIGPPVLDADDEAISLALCDRLTRFFRARQQPVVLRPVFKGCGFVDRSEGDVISGQTLYEVKAVDRGFRSTDLFQVLTYYALSKLGSQFEITEVGVVNPKKGVGVEIAIDQLARSVSGLDAAALSDEISRAISSGEISR